MTMLQQKLKDETARLGRYAKSLSPQAPVQQSLLKLQDLLTALSNLLEQDDRAAERVLNSTTLVAQTLTRKTNAELSRELVERLLSCTAAIAPAAGSIPDAKRFCLELSAAFPAYSPEDRYLARVISGSFRYLSIGWGLISLNYSVPGFMSLGLSLGLSVLSGLVLMGAIMASLGYVSYLINGYAKRESEASAALRSIVEQLKEPMLQSLEYNFELIVQDRMKLQAAVDIAKQQQQRLSQYSTGSLSGDLAQGKAAVFGQLADRLDQDAKTAADGERLIHQELGRSYALQCHQAKNPTKVLFTSKQSLLATNRHHLWWQNPTRSEAAVEAMQTCLTKR